MKRRKVYNWDHLDVVLDCNTVADIFQVNKETVKNMIYSGKLKGKKFGRKWIFDKEYIKSIVEVSEERSGSDER